MIRQKAAQYRVPVYTCLDTARCLLKAIDVKINNIEPDYFPISVSTHTPHEGMAEPGTL
jgi:carbamoyl-phosphate synthase large subunit